MGSRLTTSTTIRRCTGFSGPVVVEGPGSVEIGMFCAIGENLRIITTDHGTHVANMHMSLQTCLELPEYYQSRGPVMIGPAAWIGDSVMVLGNVEVGAGAVVGAGSVVTSNIPPFAVAAGVPASVKRYRFADGIIEVLMEARWWEWSIEEMKQRRAFFAADLTQVSVHQLRSLLEMAP